MQYKGDGSYKVNGRVPEISFLELINQENSIVSKLNEAYNALDVAKKSNIRTSQYTQMIDEYTNKLEEVRTEIKVYCSEKLGIRTDIAEKLYAAENNYTKQTINLTRMRRNK